MKVNRSIAAGAAAALSLAAIGFGVVRRRRIGYDAARFDGKVVLITGGSRGLGFAIAGEFAARGARVALTSRHQGELDSAKARLVAEYGVAEDDIFAKSCDVGVPDEVNELVAAVTAYFRKIDILVNNAGVIMVGPLDSFTLAHFEEAMRINFFGAVHCALAVLPQMMAKRDGAIVNIASVGGKIAFPHLLPYVASKHALVGWSQGMRTELAPNGIRVVTVNPGVMRTGSHIQAKFTGDAEGEYRWFAAAATFPGTAVEGSVAAKKVVTCLLKNSAEASIGLQALIASRLSNLSPEMTATLLSLANSLLPGGGAREGSDPKSNFSNAESSAAAVVSGDRFRYSLPKLMQRFGEDAIRRYNQGTGSIAKTQY